MSRGFTLTKWFRVKAEKEYPWPCKAEPNRTWTLYPQNVLTRSPDGTYTKQDGLGMFGIVVPDEDVEEMSQPVAMRFL